MMTAHPSLLKGVVSIILVTAATLKPKIRKSHKEADKKAIAAKWANDLAHEICHAFTLGKEHDIDGVTKADSCSWEFSATMDFHTYRREMSRFDREIWERLCWAVIFSVFMVNG